MDNKNKQKEKDQQEEKKTITQKILAFLKEFAIVFGLFLLINNFIVASFLVPTGSMENEVMTGELLFVNKFIYGGTSPMNLQQFDMIARIATGFKYGFPNVPFPWFRLPAFKDVARGDVIVFIFPGNRDEVQSADFMYYLKRCIGVAGDTIQIKDRVITVNGNIFPIPRNILFDRHEIQPKEYVDENIFPVGAPWNQDNYGPIVVPKKGMEIKLSRQNLNQWKIFIMREGHKVEYTDENILIDGKLSNSYIVERDYLFGMGDHRDNSLDSRYWGFIPKDNVVGTPMIVYWSWNSDLEVYDIFGRIASVRWGRIGSLIK